MQQAQKKREEGSQGILNILEKENLSLENSVTVINTLVQQVNLVIEAKILDLKIEDFEKEFNLRENEESVKYREILNLLKTEKFRDIKDIFGETLHRLNILINEELKNIKLNAKKD